MTLDDLLPYFDSVSETEYEKLNELYEIFLRDFKDEYFYLNDCKVVIKNYQSKSRGFTQYCETFVHIITRKSELKGKRILDSERANRIHWIRPILENKSDSRIKYFQYTEADGAIRDYYWFREKDFMVIVEKITMNYLLITGFVLDQDQVRRYDRRLNHYNYSLNTKKPHLR